ncbi:hypothetical protein ABEB36_012007 [Hypothenemus hampei]|uniref:Uncharacterized protein n=1 Tax=Hypothenemus hampei TaxID=57062 RepID=A0ABD1E9R7_HYPHA
MLKKQEKERDLVAVGTKANNRSMTGDESGSGTFCFTLSDTKDCQSSIDTCQTPIKRSNRTISQELYDEKLTKRINRDCLLKVNERENIVNVNNNKAFSFGNVYAGRKFIKNLLKGRFVSQRVTCGAWKLIGKFVCATAGNI